jgi:polyisoprenoid-binding protein YceI
MRTRAFSKTAFIVATAGTLIAATSGQHTIDPRNSVITIKVSKAGAFSAFGHDHVIGAPVAGGEVDPGARRVELHVKASALRVKDPKVSDKDRAEIQKTMLGPQVLDSERHAEIIFKSTSAESANSGSWTVHGTLTLRGQTHPVSATVRENNGHYVGAAVLKQSEFGIEPIKAAGGTIRVKDELRIDFDIRLEGNASASNRR